MLDKFKFDTRLESQYRTQRSINNHDQQSVGMYIVIDTRATLPSIMPTNSTNSNILNDVLSGNGGQDRAQTSASLSSSLKNIRDSLAITASSLHSTAETKILSIIPSTVKLILDDTDNAISLKKKITNIKQTKHLCLSESSLQTQNSTLLAKSITAFRRWGKKKTSSVLIFLLYVPLLDTALTKTLRDCDAVDISINFIILDDSCLLGQNINNFSRAIMEQGFGANLTVTSIFSETSEILIQMRNGLEPLLPKWNFTIVEKEKETNDASSSIHLLGSPSILTPSNSNSNNNNNNTKPTLLIATSRILLGSVPPEYLNDMHYIRPSQQNSNSLEDTNVNINNLFMLLKSLKSNGSDNCGLGLLLEADGNDRNKIQYLLVSASTVPGAACGRLYRLRAWTDVLPRPPDVTTQHKSSTSSIVSKLATLPLTNFDALQSLLHL